jgi:hypothetical protein
MFRPMRRRKPPPDPAPPPSAGPVLGYRNPAEDRANDERPSWREQILEFAKALLGEVLVYVVGIGGLIAFIWLRGCSSH